MKQLAFLLVLAASLIGCETPGQKMLDLKAEEQAREVKETFALLPLMNNMGDCAAHLGINILTAEDSLAWRKFAKSHHIDSYPRAMSDADLQDCLKILVVEPHR